MEHWFDQLARRIADQGLSRRQVLLSGARAFAGAALAGGGYALIRRPPGAQATGCVTPLTIPQECYDIGSQVQTVADAACATELPANQQYCYEQAAQAAGVALLQCVKKAQATNQCGSCQFCSNSGECVSMCPLPCTRCDASLLPDYPCVDTCPPDEYCDRTSGGTCAKKCPFECAKYDPSTRGCNDTCAKQDPCTVCRRNGCQRLCDSTCGGCPSGLTCCSGECVNLDTDEANCGSCGHHCPIDTPTCSGGVCQPCGSSDSCPSDEQCCSGQCTDTQTDPNNCGECGKVCPAGQVCCSRAALGLGGVCSDLNNNVDCASCNNGCDVNHYYFCENRVCVYVL